MPALVVLVLAGLTAGAFGGDPDGLREAFGGFFPPLPDVGEWRTAAVTMLPAQLPLTLLNSVVAVCLLSADYFPGRGVRAPIGWRRAWGLMNLLTVPFGRDARLPRGPAGWPLSTTSVPAPAGRVVMLGGLKIAGGLALLALPAAAVTEFPPPLLGALLIAAGWRLATAARKANGPANVAVAVVTGAAVVGAGTLWGVAAGVLIWAAVRRGVPAGGGRGDSDAAGTRRW